MAPGNINNNTYIISNNGGLNGTSSDYNNAASRSLNIYFKSSLLIEAYANSDNKPTQSNYYKNIYSLFQ